MPCKHGYDYCRGYDNCFCDHFPEVSRNIDGCGQLAPKDKEAFYETVNRDAGEGASKDEFKNRAEEYCRNGNKFKGSNLSPRPEYIGRMHAFSTVDEALEANSGYDGTGGGGDIDFRDLVLKGQLADLIILKDLLCDIIIHSQMIWFFYANSVTGQPVSPFHGIDPHEVCELPCRLGLTDEARTGDYFPLEIATGDEMILKKPTAFDAECDERWKPTGETHPGAGCSGKAGFREGVMPNGADPLTFGDDRVMIPPCSYCGGCGKTIH